MPPVGEHVGEAGAAGGSEAVIASGRAAGGGFLADGDVLFVGEAGEDGVEGGFGEGEAIESGEALEQLVAVGFLLAERGQDEQLHESLAELGDPGLFGIVEIVRHAVLRKP